VSTPTIRRHQRRDQGAAYGAVRLIPDPASYLSLQTIVPAAKGVPVGDRLPNALAAKIAVSD